ncbi:chromosome partitioning protein ParA [Haematobacter missouriensis]|uniref:Chromosome partitioning protein ParA n=4 Tax=Paracoccaceae TaxID=31989 RepID=A0A086XWF0_9RHOB|nr:MULTISPECIES: plasmid partitioning protein RepA [Paracoccaceae]KFI26350.1 chromosome partitioning protein ParA [Haematobacter massiliensis]KFI29138.1 chromosome partitioning protein ParA [Haematobacter missouriensis]MCB5411835.1 plasmid partitioning protein RepA [Pseudogemmobacter faecipullorum]OWJ73581.1 plasmid partitioning protein RepA [Haematobacter missouriensis]OWJ73828.1 plasmid partitioning protein RepA [Haematobacter massiliensis]
MIPVTPLSADRPSALATDISERLNAAIREHLLAAFAPDNTKTLREFSAPEVAELLDVSGQFMRKVHADGVLPEPATNRGGRRYYSGQEILQAREILERTSRKKGHYLPRRMEGEKLQVWQLMNFKGGSSKSTTTIHLAHYLALQGYRVLVVDLDPQGSLTSMCGISPEIEFDGLTIYDAIKYENPSPMADVIVQTYFPGLAIAPSRLVLSEFETESAVHSNPERPFYFRIRDALAQVEADYDLVLMDSPPQLGFLTISGMAAATSIIVPMTPSMLDVSSTAQFLELAGAYMGVIEDAGAELNYDHFKLLITRDEPTDIPSQQITSFMRALFQDRVMSATALKSTAISDATMLKQSLYEVVRSDMTRATYDRARGSMDAIGREIETMVRQTWGRK